MGTQTGTPETIEPTEPMPLTWQPRVGQILATGRDGVVETRWRVHWWRRKPRGVFDIRATEIDPRPGYEARQLKMTTAPR